MTHDRNDRRRRPDNRPGRKPGGSSGSSWRGNSPQKPPRGQGQDSERRGFTPDSGYRPSGEGPPRDQRDQRDQRSRRDRRDRQWSPSEGGRPAQRPNRPQGGYHQGAPGAARGEFRGRPERGPERYPRDQGPGGGPRDPNRQGGMQRDRGPHRGGGGPRDGYGEARHPRQHFDRRSRDDRNRQEPRREAQSAPAPAASRSGKLEPFDLFCAYHLGITPDKKFRPANLNEVARRFSVGPGELKQALQDFGMDAAVVMEKEFDMAMAQLDIELAPEGIDRVELARQIYADYLEAPRRKIDWKKIIEEDIRENAKIFGRRD